MDQGNASMIDAEQLGGLLEAAGLDGLNAILDAFWRSTDDLLAALKAETDARDVDQAAKTAHAVKGSAANVGAHALAEAARLVENACRDQDFQALDSAVAAVSNAYAATRTAITEFAEAA